MTMERKLREAALLGACSDPSMLPPATQPSIYPSSIHLPTRYLPIQLPPHTHTFSCLPINPSTHLIIHLHIHTYHHPFIHPSVCLFIGLPSPTFLYLSSV